MGQLICVPAGSISNKPLMCVSEGFAADEPSADAFPKVMY